MKLKKFLLVMGLFLCAEMQVDAAPIKVHNRELNLEYVCDKEAMKETGTNFEKEKEVFYVDPESGEKIKQVVHGTCVGWTLVKDTKKVNKNNFFQLGEKVNGADLKTATEENGVITYGKPCDDYKGPVNENENPKTPFINLYAFYDYGPVIEAYDRYYTLEEAKGGIITEDELLNAAKATDEELKSSTNPDGKLKNHEDAENGTSFAVYDYQAEEFTDLGGPAVISITYRAEDAAGNVTKKMIKVHIIDGHDTIIDGHDIGTDPDEGKVRFISEKYLDTLDENSVWVKNDEYRAELAEVVSYKRSNPKQSDPVPLLGDDYTVDIPGTGTWNTTPQSVWTFTREQVKEAQKFVEDYGPSNYEHEDGLEKFYEKFSGCRQ